MTSQSSSIIHPQFKHCPWYSSDKCPNNLSSSYPFICEEIQTPCTCSILQYCPIIVYNIILIQANGVLCAKCSSIHV